MQDAIDDELSQYFNPRPLRRGRQYLEGHGIDTSKFQSTPPAEGATYIIRNDGK